MKKRLKDKLLRKKNLNASAEAETTPAAQFPSSQIAADVRAGFVGLIRDLHKVIDEFDDEELLRLGKESEAYRGVVKLVEIRDAFFAVKHNIPAADRPDEVVADFNRAVTEAWQKLGEKWKTAGRRYPEIVEEIRGEWGNIKIEKERTPFQIELEELKESMDKLAELRPTIEQAIEADPNNQDALGALAELEGALETGGRRMSALLAKTLRHLIINTYEQLNDDIENTTDEEIIESIADTAAARRIRDYADVPANFEQAIKNLHAEDKPEEILAVFDRTIVEARRKLKDKRDGAEQRNPLLKKEYPMSESYDRALADLLEVIKTRDEMAEALELAPPEKRSEGLRLLRELDRKIEQSEQVLAVEYEAFQNHARAVDALRDEVKLASVEELKHLRRFLRDNPAEMPELRKLLAEEFPE